MKIAKVATDEGPRLALISSGTGDTTAALLAARRLDELFTIPDWAENIPLNSGHQIITNPTMLRLCEDTTRIFCVGHNYLHHIKEMGRAVPEFPTVFPKLGSATIGPYDDIALSPASQAFDWEAELAVVVAAPIRNATEAEARRAVGGYTLVNDVTARDWQHRTSQWFLGKNFDDTTPVGPALVTRDELPHDQNGNLDIEIRCEVNGDVHQRARTSDLVFTIPRLLSYLSTCIGLRPGDIVATGTPNGVGAASHPPQFLRDGDTVTVHGAGIGTCVNTCRSVDRPAGNSLAVSEAGASR